MCFAFVVLGTFFILFSKRLIPHRKGVKMGRDWLPSSRGAILAMAQGWLKLFKVKGEDVWRMDKEDIAEFESVVTKMVDCLAVPIRSRSEVTNTILRRASFDLVVLMRYIKRRYFLVPPLSDSDFVALGLKIVKE
jgi:hypothetical protein